MAEKKGRKANPLYRKWCSMRERCNNPHNKKYDHYGGRGITVCKEWDDFDAFYKWSIEHGWKEGLTIDRIDNDKGYSPDNCRYVSQKEQNRNYSRNHNITYNGETHCIKEWSEITGINRTTILWRIKNGKSLNEVFATDDKRYNRITYNGETHCLKEWSEITGINRVTILWRLKQGKSLDEVFRKERLDGR